MEEICLEKERVESKRKPRFLADGVGIIGGAEERDNEGLSIFEVCCGRPIKRNSVLAGLRVK